MRLQYNFMLNHTITDNENDYFTQFQNANVLIYILQGGFRFYIFLKLHVINMNIF